MDGLIARAHQGTASKRWRSGYTNTVPRSESVNGICSVAADTPRRIQPAGARPMAQGRKTRWAASRMQCWPFPEHVAARSHKVRHGETAAPHAHRPALWRQRIDAGVVELDGQARTCASVRCSMSAARHRYDKSPANGRVVRSAWWQDCTVAPGKRGAAVSGKKVSKRRR